jgi:hypothetical protein
VPGIASAQAHRPRDPRVLPAAPEGVFFQGVQGQPAARHPDAGEHSHLRSFPTRTLGAGSVIDPHLEHGTVIVLGDAPGVGSCFHGRRVDSGLQDRNGPFFRLWASLQGADRLLLTTAVRRARRRPRPPKSGLKGDHGYNKTIIGEVSGCSLPDSLGRGGIVCVAIC